jgi:hypothetical protein
MHRVNSAYGVVDVSPLGRPTAEVESRAVEPAIDRLESEVGDRDWEFLYDGILVDLAAELPLEVVQSTGRTSYESRVFEATDDVRDGRLLQTQSKAEPMDARSVRRIGRERILQCERDEDFHFKGLRVEGISRSEGESAKRRCSEGRQCYGAIAPPKAIMRRHGPSL